MREVEAAALLYREAMAREAKLGNEAKHAREYAERVESDWHSASSAVRQARQALLEAAQRVGG